MGGNNNTSAAAAHEQESDIGFVELRLRPGTMLHFQTDTIGAPVSEIHFLSSVPDKIIMLTQKAENSKKTPLKKGNKYIVRGFSGQYDFTFTTTLTETYLAPFEYAAFEYPATVRARLVRQHERVKTAIPASITLPDLAVISSASLINLSVDGALIESSATLGAVGDKFQVEFSSIVEKEKKELTLSAKVRHAQQGENGKHQTGVEFLNIDRNDKLVLYYIVHELAEKLQVR